MESRKSIAASRVVQIEGNLEHVKMASIGGLNENEKLFKSKKNLGAGTASVNQRHRYMNSNNQDSVLKIVHESGGNE